MALNEKEVQEFKNEFIRLNGEREANLSSVMVLIKTIESLQHENEKLKDENASLRNWNACEEKAHNKLLESDKRRWELEEKLEDANNYLEGLEAIVDKLRAHVARMREAIQEFADTANILTGSNESIIAEGSTYWKFKQVLSDTPADYHNPADVEALRKAREALEMIFKKHINVANHDKYPKTWRICSEAIAEIDKVIGGKEE